MVQTISSASENPGFNIKGLLHHLAAPSGCQVSLEEKLYRVGRIRCWVYENTAVAAGGDGCISYEQYPLHLMAVDRCFDLMFRNVGGYFCSGVAHLLQKTYVELGYNSWVLHYGEPGMPYHSTTLIEVDNEIYIQDAYFNCTYVDKQEIEVDIKKLLWNLARGNPSQMREIKSYRKVLHPGTKRFYETNWSLQNMAADTMQRLSEKCYVVRSWTRFVDYVTYFESHTKRAYQFLKRHSFPENVHFMLLFPHAVTSNVGYTDNPDQSRMLAWLCLLIKNASIDIEKIPDWKTFFQDNDLLKT